MMPAVFGPTAARSASRSTSPSASDRHFTRHAAAHGRRRRIGAVRRLRHDDLVARQIAAGAMIGTNHRHAGELAVCAGQRTERHAAHAGDGLEHLLQLVHAGEEPLAVRLRAPADAGPRTPATAPRRCRPSGCTSWCRSRADRNACRSRSSAATGGCSGAPTSSSLTSGSNGRCCRRSAAGIGRHLPAVRCGHCAARAAPGAGVFEDQLFAQSACSCLDV